MRELLRERVGPFGFALIRALLLFADIKPVRLDPTAAVRPGTPGEPETIASGPGSIER